MENEQTETSTAIKKTFDGAKASFICMLIWVAIFAFIHFSVVYDYQFHISKTIGEALFVIGGAFFIMSPAFGFFSILYIRFSKKPLRGYLLSCISIFVFALWILFFLVF